MNRLSNMNTSILTINDDDEEVYNVRGGGISTSKHELEAKRTAFSVDVAKSDVSEVEKLFAMVCVAQFVVVMVVYGCC